MNSILLEAENLVNGERQAQYADPRINFKYISEIVTAMLGKELTPKECCVVMIAVKLARNRFKYKRDNLVDLAGYTEILNRLCEEEECNKTKGG